MREQMRDRLADKSAEQREARLQQMRDRLADESAEQRDARLQQMRDRLADESAEQREARLQHMREQMRDRLILTLTLNNNISKTTNSACAHQLRLAPQYDMHITSMYMDRERSTRLCSLVLRPSYIPHTLTGN